jgi:hypothetical protein
MTKVSHSEKDDFFVDVNEACKKAVWCAIATVAGDSPRVRIVHPTWEGDMGGRRAVVRRRANIR